MIDKEKAKMNMKKQWIKFGVVTALYLLFLLWVKSWLGLIIVPFIFAYNPQMLFENVTSVFQIIQIVITALLGIFAVAAGLEGYILRPMCWPLRVLAVIGGLTLLIPGTVSDLIGLVIVAGIIALQVMQNKKEAREAV